VAAVAYCGGGACARDTTAGPSATCGQVRGGAGGGIRCDPRGEVRAVPGALAAAAACCGGACAWGTMTGPRATRGQVRSGAGGGIPRDPHGEVGDDAGTGVRRDLLGGVGLALLATLRSSAGRRGRSGHLQFPR
jgi:hypothetical protein